MSTTGIAVPLVMVPRFTGYVGPGTYATAPLDVSAYSAAHLTLWRGPLVGDTGSGALFECWFETSHDALEWTRVFPPPLSPVITATDTSSVADVPVTRRWLRIVVRLTADTSDVVGITCWASGLLEKRIQ